ncbi:MAG: peptidoglycan-binding protein [Clostridia bacterium]|nr:peptidoglycan-binding protein [Clostridia bacterium]
MLYRIDAPREVISEIQRYLLQVAYSDTRIPKVTVSGDYTPLTREAVTVFQGTKNLPETGQVDYATWQALYAAYLAALSEGERSVFLEEEWFDLRLGDTGHGVVVLQSRLGELARIYPSLTAPAVTGQYGLATAEAVRALQRGYGEYADGVVSVALWNRMERDYRGRKLFDRYAHIFSPVGA